jgi:hypothetical protein
MRLEVSDVRLSSEFAKMAKACKAPLPWDVDALGRVHDARGLVICELDIAGERDRIAAAHLIVLAVNTCGGFKAVSDTGGAK